MHPVLKFLKLLIVLFVLRLLFKADSFLESKQLSRSKATSHFFEELKRKCEDNLGNSSDDESTRNSEIEFHRAIRTRIVSQKQKCQKC